MEPIYAERYWAKVNKNGPVPPHRPDLGPCWIWTGALSAGYGRFRMGDQKVLYGAHRLAYEMAVGQIPEGMDACHRCDNPPCVNPAHLEPGSRRFNMADAKHKGRLRNGISIGSSNGAAKLTEAQAVEIRARYATEATGQRRLALEYGVTRNVVYEIVHGLKWRHAGTVNGNASTPAFNPSEETRTSV